MVYADFKGESGELSPEGKRQVEGIITPLIEVLSQVDCSFFSSCNPPTIYTALAIAKGLKAKILLNTRPSLYHNNWKAYDTFYEEIIRKPEHCVIAVGHKTFVEEFPNFLASYIGRGWEGKCTEGRRCCEGYAYDLKAKTWKLFPEDFRR